MAKVFDLSSYLEEKKSTIKLGEEEFEINEGFNDLLKIDALSNRRDEMESTEFVTEFLKIALGEEAAETLIERNYKSSVYLKIMNCIEEVFKGEDEEDAMSTNQPTLV